MDAFTAIADPTRRALLVQLAQGSARVVDLAVGHAVSRPAISRHLRVLSEAGLVRGADRGRERHYTLDTGPLGQVQEFLGGLANEQHPPVSEQHLDALTTEVRRTTRERRRRAVAAARGTIEEELA